MVDQEQDAPGSRAGGEHQLIAAILETVGALVVVLDAQGRIVRFNRACSQITSYTEAEVHGRFLWDFLLRPEDVEPVRAVFERLCAGQFPNAFENFWVCKDGSRRLIAWSNTALRDGDGRVAFVIGTGIDVTRHKQLEEEARRALAESRRRQTELQALLDASRAVLEHQDFEGAARSIFASAKALTGATAGYVALLTPDGMENDVLFLDSGGWPCTVDTSLPMPVRGLRAEAYRTAKPVYDNRFSESRWIHHLPPGHVTLKNVLFVPLIVHGRVAGLLGLSNKPGGFTEEDIALTRALGELAAVALRNSRMRDLVDASERRFRTLTQTATDAIVCADRHGMITMWNDGAQRIFGYAPEQAIGMPLTSIMPAGLRAAHSRALQDLAAGGTPTLTGRTLELTGQKADGTVFPLELSLASWTTAEGVFFTGIVRDITERIRVQKELQEAHDRLASANQDLARFAYVASHDLQEPLRMVTAFLSLLNDRYGSQLEDKARQYIGRAVEGAGRMHALIRDLLEYSRADRPEAAPSPVDANECLASALADLDAAIQESGTLISSETLPALMINRASLSQLFQNLVGNAIKFRSTERTCRVHIAAAREGDHWLISVRDNGIGIDPRFHESVFDVFQRLHTRDRFPGTGIGLAICKRIVERRGGRIWVDSTPGEGSTFRFSLADSPATSPPDENPERLTTQPREG